MSSQLLVQSNGSAGNQIIVYNRAANGTLAKSQSVSTGGVGGINPGAGSDPLSSQGSPVFDTFNNHNLVFAVNAGSNTISVLSLINGTLTLKQTLPSGGQFPVSIAVCGNLVYVLNAHNNGAISGYSIDSYNVVHVIPGSTLGLNLTPATDFTQTPGQISFTPDGSHLVITTKANPSGSNIILVGITSQGLPSGVTLNHAGIQVPFGFVFDASGRLVVTDAAQSGLTLYKLNGASVTSIQSLPNAASPTACWIASAGDYYYVANNSGSISGYHIPANGSAVHLFDLPAGAGTIDLTVSSDKKYLYSQAGGSGGSIRAYMINSDGSLTQTPVAFITLDLPIVLREPISTIHQPELALSGFSNDQLIHPVQEGFPSIQKIIHLPIFSLAGPSGMEGIVAT